MAKGLTDRQREILDFIENYIEENNRPPTISEIKIEFGFRSPQSVVDHLKALERKAYIKRIPNSRGIVLLKSGNKNFPILGKVAAGNPLAAEECFDGYFKLEDYYNGDKTFILKVEGDSMINTGIRDGDMVIVEQKEKANNGEIVVAVLNNEYTVKKFYYDGKTIKLKPENNNYDPITITDEDEDFRIIGKVVGVHRVI